MAQQVTHYNGSVSLMQNVTQGEGECGQYGRVSAYAGFVTCTTCKALAQVDTQAQGGAASYWQSFVKSNNK